MFEKTIEFIAPEEYIKNHPDLLPTPIKLNIPEWYKKLKHHINKKTVKGCMPFLDTLVTGYLLKLPTDFYIGHNIEINGKKATHIVAPHTFSNSLGKYININYEDSKEYHETFQMEESPLVNKNKNLPFHKIMNPWTIKTPSGYSCLFVPPLNNRDDRFEIISGIVDTDTFETEINFPIVLNGDKYPNLKTNLKVGTPYVQIIPFKREAWKMKIKNRDEKKYNESRFFQNTYILDNYKKKYWYKKSWK